MADKSRICRRRYTKGSVPLGEQRAGGHSGSRSRSRTHKLMQCTRCICLHLYTQTRHLVARKVPCCRHSWMQTSLMQHGCSDHAGCTGTAASAVRRRHRGSSTSTAHTHISCKATQLDSSLVCLGVRGCRTVGSHQAETSSRAAPPGLSSCGLCFYAAPTLSAACSPTACHPI